MLNAVGNVLGSSNEKKMVSRIIRIEKAISGQQP